MRSLQITIVAISVSLITGLVAAAADNSCNALSICMKGTIRNENGVPLDGVDVYVVDLAGNEKYAQSDQNGVYKVEMPVADEIRVVLFDTSNANAKRMTVAVHIDPAVNNDISWVLKPMNSLDRTTREFFQSVLRELGDRSNSDQFRGKVAEFLIPAL